MGLVLEYLTMLLVVLLWILLGYLNPVVQAVPAGMDQHNETTVSLKSIREIEKEMENLAGSITKTVMPYFVRNANVNISRPCVDTLFKIFVDVRKLKVPAIKLLDAMAKPPYGLLKGTMALMGDYDECLEVSANRKGDSTLVGEEEYYHGQYCTVEVDVPPAVLQGMQDYNDEVINRTEFGQLGNFFKEIPGVKFVEDTFTLRVGVCLPSTCVADDLRAMLTVVPDDFLSLRVSRCEDGRDKKIDANQIIFLSVLCLLGAFVLFGTLADAYLHVQNNALKMKGKFWRLLLGFSAYSNTVKLLNTNKNPGQELHVLKGLFVIGVINVIIFHTYFTPFLLVFARNTVNLGFYLNNFEFTLIATLSTLIDIYFILSGLTLVYPRFRTGRKDIRINVIQILWRRYLRLCPAVLFTLGIIIVLPLIGSGPVWADIFGKAAENAKRFWWTYALMFNNFIPIKNQIFSYLWFIPCLMQMSVLGVIQLWIFAKYRKLGMWLIIGVGVVCNIVLGVLTAVKHYPPTFAVYYYHQREYFEETIYTSPLSHVFSYNLGMLLGYFMARNPTLKLSKIQVILAWLSTLFLTLGGQFVMYAWRDGKDPYPVLAALYGGTHRPAYSLGVSWIILASTYGYAGFVGRIFCWKGFGPLCKLGYFAYLVHYIVMAFHVSSARSPIQFSHYENWMRICSYTLATFLMAYVLYIVFELPFTHLESFILRSPNRSTDNNNGNRIDAKAVVLHLNGTSLPMTTSNPISFPVTASNENRLNHAVNIKLHEES